MNRVGDRFRDQTRLSGHHDRLQDLACFAELGITRLRYPALWERIAPQDVADRDWRWTDERLAECARLGIEPILELLHHGSGPAYTDLLADNFVAQFADFAEATARRYPQVQDWIPVNEPLTTARFSALYGVWYPHAHDERSFWLALLNQVDAVRAGMAAIRRVRPDARLIQTEDLGRYYAPPSLAEPAAHLNHRRWASWDLLTGRFTPDHPLWERVAALGLGDRLRAIAASPCPPDILGVNFYATSERFIDDRAGAHPSPLPPAGYHDVAAVRVLDPPPPGLPALLREAWTRYRLPLAVTESHLGCSREEQLRWLWQAWEGCTALETEGVDLRGFTAWALLGAFDWDSLLAVEAGHYEPGAFDVRGPEPRPTAIARLLRVLAAGETPDPAAFPGIDGPGWWQRPIRLEHPRFAWSAPAAPSPPAVAGRPVLITGATGTLGQALARECALRGLPYRLTDRATLPIDDPVRVARWLDEHQPWAVLNAAGWVRVDDAEETPAPCLRANGDAAALLARACAARGIRCVLFSSDLVFDGAKDSPYLEADAPNPLSVYGASKQRAEVEALAAAPDTLVVRTAAFFSPHDPHNFAMAVERTLRSGEPFEAAAAVVTPTFVPDLVRATMDLTVDGESGLWHLTNGDAVSWVEFGRQVAAALGLDPSLVREASPTRLGWRAARPAYAALGTTRGQLLPPLADAIARHAGARRKALDASADAGAAERERRGRTPVAAG